jgi:uncharacterized membrane protein
VKSRVSIVPVAIFLSLVSLAPSAWAGFRVCNQSDEKVSVAIGYNNRDFGWVSEGWWDITPGECVTLLRGDLNQRYYYIYAESENRQWSGEKFENGGYFCISSSRFTLRNADFEDGDTIDCESGGQKTKHFRKIDTKSYTDYTDNLTE